MNLKYETKCNDCDLTIFASSEEELDVAMNKHYIGKKHQEYLREYEILEKESELNFAKYGVGTLANRKYR